MTTLFCAALSPLSPVAISLERRKVGGSRACFLHAGSSVLDSQDRRHVTISHRTGAVKGQQSSSKSYYLFSVFLIFFLLNLGSSKGNEIFAPLRMVSARLGKGTQTGGYCTFFRFGEPELAN